MNRIPISQLRPLYLRHIRPVAEEIIPPEDSPLARKHIDVSSQVLWNMEAIVKAFEKAEVWISRREMYDCPPEHRARQREMFDRREYMEFMRLADEKKLAVIYWADPVSSEANPRIFGSRESRAYMGVTVPRFKWEPLPPGVE